MNVANERELLAMLNEWKSLKSRINNHEFAGLKARVRALEAHAKIVEALIQGDHPTPEEEEQTEPQLLKEGSASYENIKAEFDKAFVAAEQPAEGPKAEVPEKPKKVAKAKKE